MTNLIECVWLGQTGSTPGVGFTTNGEFISLDKEKFENLKKQGLVKLKPKPLDKPILKRNKE